MNYDKLATEVSVNKTIKALKAKGYEAYIVKTAADALAQIKKLIPDDVAIMNGSSVTLEQIGYIDYLKSGKHKWVDLHSKIVLESDREKRSRLRREAALSDYYLGSVHALTEAGEFAVASNTGSQLPHIVFTSPNLIFVVSTKKIVNDLPAALERIEKHAYPLEDKHLMKLYNAHTALNKIVLFKGESPLSNRKICFILVEQDLGY